jgi:hypothetical protein
VALRILSVLRATRLQLLAREREREAQLVIGGTCDSELLT